MTTTYTGQYVLRITFGKRDMILYPSGGTVVSVSQYMDRFLPALRIMSKDPSLQIEHLMPSDRRAHKVNIQFAVDVSLDVQNSFDFIVYRRFPNFNDIVDVEGLLDITGLFSPDKVRGWDDSISTAITDVVSEFSPTFDKVDISPGLSRQRIIVQPGWSNAKFLNYLKHTANSSGDQAGFYCFVKREENKTNFLFKHHNEFVGSKEIRDFVVGDINIKDTYPIFDYNVFNNYGLIGAYASLRSNYSYFDYGASEYVEATTDLSNYSSLADFYLIDKSDSIENNISLDNLGRNNEYNADFKGNSLNCHYKTISSLVSMWIKTLGAPDLYPGNVIKIVFPAAVADTSILSYQYSGLWLIKETVHEFGQSFTTKLLLERCGIDTDLPTSLVKAKKA